MSTFAIDPRWAWQPYRPSEENPWNLKRVGHLYRRAAFGANRGELQAALERWSPLRLRKPDTSFLSRPKPIPSEHLLDQSIIAELREYGIDVIVHDPLAEAAEAVVEYGIRLSAWEEIRDVDGMVLAVAHKAYKEMELTKLLQPLKTRDKGVFVDVKGVLAEQSLGSLFYWRL